MWRPCLLMYRDKISHLYKEPSMDASDQISVHLAKRNCLWRPCLLMDRDKMRNRNR
jgi:hypothetical protein